MKKITFLLLVATQFSFCTIIYRDIAYVSFTTSGQEYSFDFDNNGSTEFSVTYIQSLHFLYNNGDVTTTKFFTHTNSFSASGWDAVKPLSFKEVIGATSIWGPTDFNFYGSTSPAPFSERFPVGDSYVGCYFNIGTTRHYGWILLNVNQNDIFTIKSYAYEDNASTQILAGTQSLSTSDFNFSKINCFYNSFDNSMSFTNTEDISSLKCYNLLGQEMQTSFNNNILKFTFNAKGIYVLNFVFKDDKVYSKKVFLN